MSDRVVLTIHLRPDEYEELAAMARAARDAGDHARDTTAQAEVLVRAGLPGTQARVLDAARVTDADA